MAIIIGLIVALLVLFSSSGSASSPVTGTPVAETGSVTVVARACAVGATAATANPGACAVYAGGAAVMLTDENRNAFGMNAGRDASLPGDPVTYSLDHLALGAYTLGPPDLPAGFASLIIAGDGVSKSGDTYTLRLDAAHPEAHLIVYYIRAS